MSYWKLEQFIPSLTRFIFSTNNINHSMMSCEKNLMMLSFFKVYTLNLSTLWKITVPSICSFLMTRAELCNTKEFVDIATDGRCRRFSTKYNKHNLFQQSKLGGDVELQNTHIVLFKSPRDCHQVATLSVQLGPGSALVELYRDATSLTFVICWLICLREQTIAYATSQKAEKFYQNFMYPTTWNIWNNWTRWTH